MPGTRIWRRVAGAARVVSFFSAANAHSSRCLLGVVALLALDGLWRWLWRSAGLCCSLG